MLSTLFKKNFKHIASSVLSTLVFAMAMVACGGGSHAINDGITGGITNIFKAKHNVAMKAVPVTGIFRQNIKTSSMALFFQAPAPTPSLTAQSFNGFCHTTPSGASFIVYGIGRFTDANCANNFASFTNHGSPVIDDGTFTDLYALGSGGTTAESGKVEVFDNGVLTPITCTIGTGKKCKLTGANIPALDGHEMSLRFTTVAGDNFQDVQFVLVKQ